MFQRTVVPLFENFLSQNKFLQVSSYVGDSPNDLLGFLEKQGCSKDALPAIVGGTWSYDSFFDCVDAERHQDSIEKKRKSSPISSSSVDEHETKEARIKSRRKTTLSSGLFSVLDDCLRADDNPSSKMLTLHMLNKSQDECGPASRLPILEPSDPNSELAAYIRQRPSSASSLLQDRLVEGLKKPSTDLPALSSTCMDSLVRLSSGKHVASVQGEHPASLERILSQAPRSSDGLSEQDLDQLFTDLRQAVTCSTRSTTSMQSAVLKEAASYLGSFTTTTDKCDKLKDHTTKREPAKRLVTMSPNRDESLADSLGFLLGEM